MKAVIPCAKKKDSLFPLSETKPTGLMPLKGVKSVNYLIEDLEKIGITEIYLVTNYKERQFKEAYGEYDNVEIVHQDKLEGTAEAINCCNFIEEDFIVVNGDVIISEQDLRNLRNKHKDKKGKITLLGTEENKPEKFGVLSIRDDKVVDLEEKPDDPENPLINTGIYVFSPEIFESINQLKEGENLIDAVQNFIKEETAYYELVENYWIDIGSPSKLWHADKIKRETLITEQKISEKAKIEENAIVKEKVEIGKNTVVKSGAVIEGETHIGDNCVIGPNTVIRDSSISENCQIRNAHVEESIVFEENIVDPFTYIEKSIIGEESDFKSGSVVKQSYIGGKSFIEMNNSIRGVKFVPNARTDLSEISK